MRTLLAAGAALLLSVIAIKADALDQGKPRDAAAVTGIIVHAIGGPDCKDGRVIFAPIGHYAAWWAAWFARQSVVGIHYVIGRDGDLAAGVPELEIANHARGANPNTIGIELVNNGDGIDPYPEAQVDRLVSLIQDIRRRYGIGSDGIHGHSEIDHGAPLPCGSPRKVDPGPALDLEDIVARSAP